MNHASTPTGARVDDYAREARAAYERLNAALTAAGVTFQLAGFNVVDDQGYPTFSVRLTAPQALLIAEALPVTVSPVQGRRGAQCGDCSYLAIDADDLREHAQLNHSAGLR